jgi:hypothetical protein
LERPTEAGAGMPKLELEARRKDGTIGFGVGCFHFGVSKPGPFKMTLAEYAHEVEQALKRLPTVNNIQMRVGPDKDDVFERATEDDVVYIDDGVAVPLPSHFSLWFDVFIPRRIQDEVFPNHGAWSGSENFQVHIRYEYDSPVAFVIPLRQSEDFEPTAAIPVVREYLARELNKESTTIRFGTLGPSPMHANFFVRQTPNQESAEISTFATQLGYARVDISFNTKNLIESKLLENAIALVADEADLFYHLESMRVFAIKEWREFQEEVDPLIESDAPEPLLKRFRISGRANQIQKAHRDLTMFEYRIASNEFVGEREFEKLYSRVRVPIIKPMLEELLKGQDIFPTQHIGKLLTFLEQRRSKASELAIVVLASVLGGVAGAALTNLTK